MVAIEVTSAIRAVLERADKQAAVQTTHTVSTIDHKALLQALRHHPHPAPKLHTLVQHPQATIHLTHQSAVTHLIPPSRNPKLEARVTKLKTQLQDREYVRMVHNVTSASSGIVIGNHGSRGLTSAQRDAQRLAKLTPQLSLAMNVIVTMATCFVAAYFAFYHSTGSQVAALVAGVVALVVAMVVEVVLLMSKMYSVDRAARLAESEST